MVIFRSHWFTPNRRKCTLRICYFFLGFFLPPPPPGGCTPPCTPSICPGLERPDEVTPIPAGYAALPTPNKLFDIVLSELLYPLNVPLFTLLTVVLPPAKRFTTPCSRPNRVDACELDWSRSNDYMGDIPSGNWPEFCVDKPPLRRRVRMGTVSSAPSPPLFTNLRLIADKYSRCMLLFSPARGMK